MDYEELFNQADNLRNDAKITEAVKAYSKIVELSESKNETLISARAWHMAGVSASLGVGAEDEYFRSALASYSHAEKAYASLKDKPGLGALCRDIGVVYLKVKNFTDAKIWLEKSTEILKQTEEYGQLGISYDKLANFFLENGDTSSAMENYSEALKTFDLEPTAGFFRATTFYDYAKAYAKTGDSERATELAEESLSWFMADHAAEKYNYRLAELNGLLSVLYFQLGRNKQAKEVAEKFELLIKDMPSEVQRNLMNSLSEFKA
jgi:tetratricopeptide (TPR) repeat protein